MTAPKNTAKKTTKTAEEKAQERKERQAQTGGHGTAPIATLPAGTGTQNDDPPPSNPAPIERGLGEREPKERQEDTLRLPEDKARWEYGETVDTATLLKEQRDIDAQQ